VGDGPGTRSAVALPTLHTAGEAGSVNR